MLGNSIRKHISSSKSPAQRVTGRSARRHSEPPLVQIPRSRRRPLAAAIWSDRPHWKLKAKCSLYRNKEIIWFPGEDNVVKCLWSSAYKTALFSCQYVLGSFYTSHRWMGRKEQPSGNWVWCLPKTIIHFHVSTARTACSPLVLTTLKGRALDRNTWRR